MTDRHVEYMDLGEIELAPRNPKEHDTEGIAQSISHFGLADLPTLDERTERLVAGHGRIIDLRTRYADGKPAPDGVRVEGERWLVPVIRGWASQSDTDAEAYLLAANKLSIRGGWDDAALLEMLSDLSAADFDLVTLAGFDTSDLDDLLAALEQPVIAGAIPATGARFAETEEEEQARTEARSHQTPRYTSGLVEMILVYSEDDRAEVGQLISTARATLGELRASDIILQALRVFTAGLGVEGA